MTDNDAGSQLDLLADPCDCSSAKPAIPKPSQVRFRRIDTPCDEEAPDARLLVMRLSPRFPLFGQQYTLLISCTPFIPECGDNTTYPTLNDLDFFALVDAKEGSTILNDQDILLQLKWRLVTESKSLALMCDVLIEEYSADTQRPLELYTPVVKFAAPFCEICAHVEGISWIHHYRSQVMKLDELCSNFASRYVQARQTLHALAQSWSTHTQQEITGHAALPEKWIRDSRVMHIAADASFSRHSGGASAFVTSRGDFCALPAKGSSILCCELLAIERAVQHARNHKGRVVIWSDSRMALNYIARLNSQEPYTIRNKLTRVLDNIDHVLQQRRDNDDGPMVFRWIKAHTDCSSLQRILNDGADRLARHTMRNVARGEFTPALAAICDSIVADCMNNLATLDPQTPCLEDMTSHTFEHYDIPHDTDSCS